MVKNVTQRWLIKSKIVIVGKLLWSKTYFYTFWTRRHRKIINSGAIPSMIMTNITPRNVFSLVSHPTGRSELVMFKNNFPISINHRQGFCLITDLTRIPITSATGATIYVCWCVSALHQCSELQEGYFYSEGELGTSKDQEGCKEGWRKRRAIFLLRHWAARLAEFRLKISYCCTDTKTVFNKCLSIRYYMNVRRGGCCFEWKGSMQVWNHLFIPVDLINLE